MNYTETEIKLLLKCVKYFKKYCKDIVHDSEGILWFPQSNLRIKKPVFLEMCNSIFNKAHEENLTYEDVHQWGKWDCFDITIIDIKLTISKLYENHYCVSFEYF